MINTVYSVWIVLVRTMAGEWIPEKMYVVGQTYHGKSAHKAAKHHINNKLCQFVEPENLKMKYCYLTIPISKKVMKCVSTNTGHIGW